MTEFSGQAPEAHGGHRPPRRTLIRLVPAVVLLAALVVFIVQNTRSVRIHFLVWHADMRVAFALVIAGAVGIVVGVLAPRLRRFV